MNDQKLVLVKNKKGDETAKPRKVRRVAMHPLFVHSKNPEPLTEPIERIDVHRIAGAGREPMIACVPADQLPDEIALRDRFGPGDYHLVGRNFERNKILRRVDVQVADELADQLEEAPMPSAAMVAPATAPATRDIDPIMLMMIKDAQASRDMMLTLLLKQSEKGESDKNNIVEAMASLFAERLKDQRAMIEALAAGRGNSGGDATTYQEGLAAGLALAEQSLKGGGEGESDAELVKAALEGVKMFAGGGAS